VSRRVSGRVSRRDAAALLLGWVVRLLPAAHREWGAAMLAELASVEGGPERWRFAVECAGVVVRRPAVLRRAVGVLAPVAVLAYVWWWSAGIGWAPRRWGVVAFVAVLAVVAELGLVGPLGPVGRGASARIARAVGYLLVGALAVESAWSFAHKDNNDLTGVPVLGVMLAGYLVAVLAVTSRRSPATARMLAVGLTGGLVAGGGWTALAVLDPPIPPSPGLAIAFVAVGMAGAGLLGRRDGAAPRAALIAGTTGALLVINVVTVLSSFGSAWLIPELVPAGLTPADRLANSRIELVDPYMWLLLIGWFVALTQGISGRGRPLPATTTAGSP
jgi:hypothetical protein